MKKMIRNLGVMAMLLITSLSYAQAPNAFNYQAVLRNAGGDLITGQLVEMRFTVRNSSANGTIQYRETQNLTPNEFGLVDHAIGTGTVVSGTFAGITWATGAKFLQVELNTGGGFVNLGAEKLNSVPFALYSNNPGPAGPQGPAGATGPAGPAGSANINGITNRLVKFTGATTGGNSMITDNGQNVGIEISSPQEKLSVSGNIHLPSNNSSVYIGTNTDAGDRLRLHRSGNGSYIDFGMGSLSIRPNSSQAINILQESGNVASVWEFGSDDIDPNLRAADNYGVLGRSGSRLWRVYASTYFGTNTSIQAISDKSLKTNIAPLTYGLSDLMALKPVSYDFIPEKLFPEEKARAKMTDKDYYDQMGFIAQELEEVFPGLIREITHATGETVKTVGYTGLVPVLVKAIQEQQAQIELLKVEMDLLKNK